MGNRRYQTSSYEQGADIEYGMPFRWSGRFRSESDIDVQVITHDPIGLPGALRTFSHALIVDVFHSGTVWWNPS